VAHAANGIALGWLLVETVSASVDTPLSTIAFTMIILVLAACVHHTSEREHRALLVAGRQSKEE